MLAEHRLGVGAELGRREPDGAGGGAELDGDAEVPHEARRGMRLLHDHLAGEDVLVAERLGHIVDGARGDAGALGVLYGVGELPVMADAVGVGREPGIGEQVGALDRRAEPLVVGLVRDAEVEVAVGALDGLVGGDEAVRRPARARRRGRRSGSSPCATT